MTMPIALSGYAADRWLPGGGGEQLLSAITGEVVAQMPGTADVEEMLCHARKVGGPALQQMTFQQRGRMLRALAEALSARKEELFALSSHTGATRSDSAFDIEGGIGTFFVYSAKARSMPDAHFMLDGARETISKGDFVGQHVLAPLSGVAVHINAYNFPVWGMLEKLAPTLLAGMPAIVKPGTTGAYLTEAAFRIMIDSGALPSGAVQLLLGSTGDLLDRLDGQDSVAFTGSAATAGKLKSLPNIIGRTVRFSAEQDSLNAAVLSHGSQAGDANFDLFVKEVVREITQKAGQKCTAIRRAFVPQHLLDAAQEAICARLARTVIGDPRDEIVRLGAIAGTSQRDDLVANLGKLRWEAELVIGGDIPDLGDALAGGAFFEPTLLRCDAPHAAGQVHAVEAFGPVATLMPYSDPEEAIALANMGEGSLALSFVGDDPTEVAAFVRGASTFHGRIMVVGPDNAAHATGHGAALPHLQHGGPGRAGGGAELGGTIGMMPYLQRSAIQASEAMLAAIDAG